MSTFKYVRNELIGFVIWPKTDYLAHRDVGRAMRGLVMSAGFAIISDGKCRCYGRSESLNIDSLEDDTAALAEQLGLIAQQENHND